MATISKINGVTLEDTSARSAHDSLAEAVGNLSNELNTVFQSIDDELAQTIKQINVGTEVLTPTNGIVTLSNSGNISSITIGGVAYTPSGGTITLPNYLQEGETSSTSIVLPVSGWVNNTQTINNVKGVTANNNIFVAPAGNPKAYADAGIYCSAQDTNSLTFVCETIPTENITVNVQIDTDGVGGWEYVGFQASTDTFDGVISLNGPGNLGGDAYLLLIRYYVYNGVDSTTPIVAFLVKNGDDPMRSENSYYYQDTYGRIFTSRIEQTSRGLIVTNYDSSGNEHGHDAYQIKAFKCKLPMAS